MPGPQLLDPTLLANALGVDDPDLQDLLSTIARFYDDDTIAVGATPASTHAIAGIQANNQWGILILKLILRNEEATNQTWTINLGDQGVLSTMENVVNANTTSRLRGRPGAGQQFMTAFGATRSFHADVAAGTDFNSHRWTIETALIPATSQIILETPCFVDRGNVLFAETQATAKGVWAGFVGLEFASQKQRDLFLALML